MSLTSVSAHHPYSPAYVAGGLVFVSGAPLGHERDADDRRIVHAELTEAGKKLIDEVAVAHFENETRMLSGMSADDQAELVQLLRKLEHSVVRHQDG